MTANRERIISILHLSDIHFTADDAEDRRVVLDALVDSVSKFWQGGHRPALVLCTGDVAAHGRDAEYARATTFFDRLLDALGLQREHLFVVPGNHDADRAEATDPVRPLASEEHSIAYFASARDATTCPTLAAFYRWHDVFFHGTRKPAPWQSCMPEVIEMAGVRLGLLLINSAEFARGANDHGNLWIGRTALDRALAQLGERPPEVALALVHHPDHWLHPEEREQIKAMLHDRMDVVLRGHLHQSASEVVASAPQASTLYVSGGATYQGRGRANQALYLTIDYDGEEVRQYPICYVDSPKPAWVPDLRRFHEWGYEYVQPVRWKAGSPSGTGGAAARRRVSRSQTTRRGGLERDPEHGAVLSIAGIDFVFMQGGEFDMGAALRDGEAFPWERYAHRVMVPSFWIARTPTTRMQFARFLAESAYREPPYWRGVGIEDSDQPVLCRNTDDVEAFCRWLTGRAQREVDLSGAGVQLTSEAEWEYAARGTGATAGRLYPWGSEPPAPERAHYGADALTSVYAHPDGETPDGVLDMAGNCFERCRDRLGWTMLPYFGGASLVIDPVGRAGEQMALRSSDHRMPADYLRATWRVGNQPFLWAYTSLVPVEGPLGRTVAWMARGILTRYVEAAIWTSVAKIGFRCTFRTVGFGESGT